MSRIGKQRVSIPDCVDVVVKKETIMVKGPKGELSFTLPPFLKIKIVEGTHLFIEKDSNFPRRKLSRKVTNELYGLARTAVFNIIKGVAEGFQKRLRLTGIGYRAAVEDGCLVLNVGYSQAVRVVIPDHISLQCETPTSLLISGVEKYQVGNFASKIRLIRVPEPYKGKGISYEDELVQRKPGKTGK